MNHRVHVTVCKIENRGSEFSQVISRKLVESGSEVDRELTGSWPEVGRMSWWLRRLSNPELFDGNEQMINFEFFVVLLILVIRTN